MFNRKNLLLACLLTLPCMSSLIAQTPTLNFRAVADMSAANQGEAVVAMQNGQIVFEEYQNGYVGTTPHFLASGTKGFMCAIAVAAQDDGLIDLDEPVSNVISTWRVGSPNAALNADFKSRITARQLLSMSSGLATGGSAGSALNNVDSYAQALTIRSAFAPGQDAIYTPNSSQAFGAYFALKTGGTLTGNGIVTGGRDTVDYLKTRVLDRIGATIGAWQRDTRGHANLPGGASFTARDWLKFGQLILQNGAWNGEQILSAARLRECMTYNNPAIATYGLGWWLNRPVGNTFGANDNVPLEFVFSVGSRLANNMPADVVIANGAFGQRMYIMPSLNLIVVRFGSGGDWGDNAFSQALLGNTANIPATAHNHQDLWWGGTAENGWGMSIAQKGNVQFNALYVYDDAGKPVWYVMPGGTWNATFSEFSGSLYQPTGSPFNQFDTTRIVVGAPQGTAKIAFRDSNNAVLTYTIGAKSGSKNVSRQFIANNAPGSGPVGPITDLWWGGTAQNGWGLSLTQQGQQLFGVWYTYNAEGKASWFVMPGGTFTGNNFTGALYATAGSPWVGTTYDPSRVVATNVGSLTLGFDAARNQASMQFSVNGVTGTNQIARQPF